MPHVLLCRSGVELDRLVAQSKVPQTTVSKHGGIAIAIDRAHGAEALGAAEELGSGGASHGLQATVGAGDRRPGEPGARRLRASW